MKTTKFEAENMTECWHKIHEYMFNNELKIKSRGGATYGSELVSHDNLIHIQNSTFDPEFDFGRVLGYKLKKWSKLINNYFDPNYLDLIKNEIIEREIKRSKNYNYAYRFDNSHGSGKDCLISLMFSRSKASPNPVVRFHTRASEATKRLAFDFLLVQRIAEYVYGVGTQVEFMAWVPFMFINLECSLMYVSEYGKEVIKERKGGYSDYQKKLLTKYEYFQTVDTDKIKYKVHQRAARQVQKDENGNPIANCPPLLAKEMDLNSSAKYSKAETKMSKGERKMDKTTALDTYKQFKEFILSGEATPEDLSKVAVALTTGTPILYPKKFNMDFFKVLTRPRHNDLKLRAVKLILNKASK